MKLTGKRISLESTKAADIPLIINFEISNSNFVHQYSEEQHLTLLSDSNCLHFSIKKQAENKLIGHAILFGLNDKKNVLYLKRITISEKGKGLGREALQILKHYCFTNIHFSRLWLSVFENNANAISLYESEGFKFEGCIPENVKGKNGCRSRRVYSMLKEDYKIP